MSQRPTIAINEWTRQLAGAAEFGQLLITPRAPGAFELRHVIDRSKESSALNPVSLSDARGLAQYTSTGDFRPHKAAPNLSSGWVMTAASAADLEFALNCFYPGALADWFAAQSTTSALLMTDYRKFTSRQSGMYRATALLTDSEIQAVVTRSCGSQSCLKQRIWPAPGGPPDPPGSKTEIPCFEPCGILLEDARKALRARQQETLFGEPQKS